MSWNTSKSELLGTHDLSSSTPVHVLSRRHSAASSLSTPLPHTLRDSDKQPQTEQFRRIQEHSLQRRMERLQQIHDLELNVARITAKLAQVTMQRQEESKRLMSESVHIPLEKMVERWSLERDCGSDHMAAGRPQTQWIPLESRLSKLQAEMVHHAQATATDKHKELFGNIEQDLQACIIPVLEQQRETKQSRLLETRMDQLAGMLKRHLLEERAARKAAIDQSAEAIKSRQELDEKRGKDYLSQIMMLRRLLVEERSQRREQDLLMKQRVNQAVRAMQKALISTVDEDLGDDALRITES